LQTFVFQRVKQWFSFGSDLSGLFFDCESIAFTTEYVTTPHSGAILRALLALITPTRKAHAFDKRWSKPKATEYSSRDVGLYL